MVYASGAHEFTPGFSFNPRFMFDLYLQEHTSSPLVLVLRLTLLCNSIFTWFTLQEHSSSPLVLVLTLGLCNSIFTWFTLQEHTSSPLVLVLRFIVNLSGLASHEFTPGFSFNPNPIV